MNRVVAAVLLASLLLGGCVGLPEDGPVVDAELGRDAAVDGASAIDVLPPEPGASRLEVVNGFLEAMMAWPIKTAIAKQYLTDAAADEWRPQRTIVYADRLTPREEGGTVSVGLSNPVALDASGSWQGPLPRGRRSLELRTTVEDGEFRIVDPVDALVVRSSWFQRRYRQVSLYYFDPTARVLVPEPVFVPVGDQIATSLVSALAAGPSPSLRRVVRTFLPPGLSVGLSVPVSEDGVATIDLQGGAPRASPEESELLLAQLAATLRQEPRVSSIRVTVGGEDIPVPGGATEYDVDEAVAFDLSERPSTGALYGLRGGRLVVGGFGALQHVAGPLGREPHDLGSVAVSPDAERVAAVDTDGREVVVAPLREADAHDIELVYDGGSDLARPAWDAHGRLWLLDRTPDGARVLVVGPDGPREVDVPGVTGTGARQLLLSRDGTRLVAGVAEPGGDRLVAVRVVLSPNGRVVRALDPIVIWSGADGFPVRDIAWAGPVEVAVLTPTRPGELFEVETVSVDGATIGVDTQSTVVPGRVIGLAGEPNRASPVYAVARDGLIDIQTGERVPATDRVRDLDYAG